MKKILILISVAVVAYAIIEYDTSSVSRINPVEEDSIYLEQAFRNQKSNIQVAGEGTISRLLSDDKEGSRHQRFIVELASGQTVLISHNIDLAPRIDALRKGDAVKFYGEYEWNPQGGVVHWTHRDPAGRHLDGWIEHEGQTFQ